MGTDIQRYNNHIFFSNQGIVYKFQHGKLLMGGENGEENEWERGAFIFL